MYLIFFVLYNITFLTQEINKKLRTRLFLTLINKLEEIMMQKSKNATKFCFSWRFFEHKSLKNVLLKNKTVSSSFYSNH